jgi:hypothetical protein
MFSVFPLWLCYNNGMENQQQQPVMPPANDFLSRMDAVEHPAPAEPEKPKLSKEAIIGIIAGAVVLVGAIVAGVIMMNSNKPAPTPTSTGYVEPDTPEIDEEAEARNKLRVNDLVPLGQAVKTYQALPESNGQLPGVDVDEWSAVILNYVAGSEIKDGATGETYKMGAVCKFGEECVKPADLSWEKNQHEIYVLYNADCKGKTKDNVIVSSTRARHVAIFAIVENNEFICTTN